MPLIDHTRRSRAGYAWLAVVAAVLTLVGLYVWPWWSGRHSTTFLEYREDFLTDRTSGDQWWNVLYESWFRFGFAVQTVAVLVLPIAVLRWDRWHWLSAAAVLGAVWQLVGVLGSTVFHTTPAPFLGPLAGVLAAVAWLGGRFERRQPAGA
ncbi:hypothetical protein [Kitasatospora sp. NPDC051914]|uniref:hypothetical protein n=1 Tax=Kitasatospora sp. NPDC051914 TaxID=3154945 RepID=UPI00341F8EA6